MRFYIIVNCGPCEQWIAKCLQSIQTQTYQDWRAIVTVDPCGDATFEKAVDAKENDNRIMVKYNLWQRYCLQNHIDAIKHSGARPEDVIVSLDGDDWFHNDTVLQTIADTYATGCWLTYGSWVGYCNASKHYEALGKDRFGMWPAYPEGTTDFRHHRWLATAVRTYKRWLWNLVGDADLRDDDGQYFCVAEDRAVMYPMLEMCGTLRARHIPKVLMVYNQHAVYAADPQMDEEALHNVQLLAGRPVRCKLTGEGK